MASAMAHAAMAVVAGHPNHPTAAAPNAVPRAAADEVDEHVRTVELGGRGWVDRKNGALVGYLSGEQTGIEEAEAGQCQGGVRKASAQRRSCGQSDDESD